MKKIFICTVLFLTTGCLATPIAFAQTAYFITAKDGTKLYVQEFGKGSPIVLLAGGPGLNPIYLKPIRKNLEKDHRCIILNQRGTGKTHLAVVDSAHLTTDDYVNDIEALRKHLGLKKLVLVGHSWGGMLIMLYLSREPEHVKKAVLIDPGGLNRDFIKPMVANMGKKLTTEDSAELRKDDSLHRPAIYALWPGYFYHRDRAIATRSGVHKIHGQKGVMKYAMTSYFTGSDKMISALRKIKNVPVILIKGKQDPEGEGVSSFIKSVLPQTQIHEINDCGHLPWLEEPRQVNEFYSILRKVLSSYSNRPNWEQQIALLVSLVKRGNLQ